MASASENEPLLKSEREMSSITFFSCQVTSEASKGGYMNVRFKSDWRLSLKVNIPESVSILSLFDAIYLHGNNGSWQFNVLQCNWSLLVQNNKLIALY